eukprot:TRINITY_DN6110_c0_g1_i1.p1 TRINITY_DN6110_c0_g1~~TRINITY_DN6110_c0_g1_i1.p1  ORF type:complete len:587 (+),score=113.72 TRINITY_DN6110_c0_g1_i1:83-1843(+)
MMYTVVEKGMWAEVAQDRERFAVHRVRRRLCAAKRSIAIYISSHSIGEYRDHLEYIVAGFTSIDDLTIYCHLPHLSVSLAVLHHLRSQASSPIVAKAIRLEKTPLQLTTLLPRTFVFPGCHNVFPSCKNFQDIQRPDRQTGVLKLDEKLLGEQMKNELLLLSTHLAHFLCDLGLKEEIYTLGPCADFVGRAVGSFKTSSNALGENVSLIIVDRLLDITGALSHFSDSIYDKTLRQHPPTSASSIPSLPPATTPSTRNCDRIGKSVFHYRDLIEKMVGKSLKDALGLIREVVVDLAQSRGIILETRDLKLSAANAVKSISELSSRIGLKPLDSDYILLQYLQSISTSISSPFATNWDQMLAHEKMFLLTFRENHISMVTQITSMLRDDSILVYDVLKFAAFAISLLSDLDQALISPEFWTFEKQLTIRFTHSILNRSDLDGLENVLGSNLLDEIRSRIPDRDVNEANEDEIKKAIYHKLISFFNGLRDVVKSRHNLSDYRRLVSDMQLGGSYASLIQQIMEHILEDPSTPTNHHSNKDDLLDLQPISTSLGSLLMTGFSRFGFSAKRSKPRKEDTMIVFVIGGITSE